MKEFAKKTGKSDCVKSGNNRFWHQQLTSFAWDRAENNFYKEILICKLITMHVTYIKDKKNEK